MSNRPRPSQPPERRQLTRRQIAAQQREANVQRRVIFALAGAVGLALLLVIGGFVYDRFVAPSQTLKRVNDVALTRADYERLNRVNLIQQMARTLQFSKLFGSNQSFGQGGRFDEQIVQANVQLDELGTARTRQQPIDETLVSQWADRQIAEQYAKEQFQLDPAGGEVDQLLVGELGSVLETASPVTGTDEISATVTAEASVAATAEASVAATSTATAVPTATPLPAEATAQADQVIDALYTEYLNILGALPEEAPQRQRTAHASKDEFAEALRAEYRNRLFQQRIGEALVTEIPADDTTTPEQISARHILLQVPRPTATPEAADAEIGATETAIADETATPEESPTPAPTPSPEELEEQFAERKAEADKIYQQLIAAPETFAEVARELSEDEGSAQQGGDVGTFNRQGQTQTGQSLVQPFVEAAWALEENEISEPVRTEFGWHIIQRLPEDPEAKLSRLRQAAYENWLAEQRAKATIVPAPTPTPTEIAPVETEAPATSTTGPEATTTP